MKQKKNVASQAEPLVPEDPKDPSTLLISGAAQLGLLLSPTQIDQMMRYLRELFRWNKKINLTAIRQEDEVIIKHFLDSLSPLTLLEPEADAHWIDVGSGAGFPALVLKIALPDLRITLVEPVQKKAAFLHHLIGLLGMRYVSVINARIEHASEEGPPGGYDLLLTRALSPTLVLDKGLSLVRAGGRLLFFQARSDRNAWEHRLNNYPLLGLEMHAPFQLPFSKAARTLVVLRKNAENTLTKT